MTTTEKATDLTVLEGASLAGAELNLWLRSVVMENLNHTIFLNRQTHERAAADPIDRFNRPNYAATHSNTSACLRQNILLLDFLAGSPKATPQTRATTGRMPPSDTKAADLTAREGASLEGPALNFWLRTVAMENLNQTVFFGRQVHALAIADPIDRFNRPDYAATHCDTSNSLRQDILLIEYLARSPKPAKTRAIPQKQDPPEEILSSATAPVPADPPDQDPPDNDPKERRERLHNEVTRFHAKMAKRGLFALLIDACKKLVTAPLPDKARKTLATNLAKLQTVAADAEPTKTTADHSNPNQSKSGSQPPPKRHCERSEATQPLNRHPAKRQETRRKARGCDPP